MIVFGKDFFGRWSCSLNRRIWGGDEFTFHPQEYKGHTFQIKGTNYEHITTSPGITLLQNQPNKRIDFKPLCRWGGTGECKFRQRTRKEQRRGFKNIVDFSGTFTSAFVNLMVPSLLYLSAHLGAQLFFWGGGGEELRSGLCGTGRWEKMGKGSPIDFLGWWTGAKFMFLDAGKEDASHDKRCREAVFLSGAGGGDWTSQWCWEYGSTHAVFFFLLLVLLLLCLVVAMPPPARLGETERNLDASAREGLKWLMEELMDFHSVGEWLWLPQI